MPAKKSNARQSRRDTADTYGVRGAGAATWQARFGMPLNENDLLFAARREPVAKRTVIDVAHDIFAKGFTVEEVSEKPDPNWSREVAKVLDDLNARACLTRLFLFERLFGWAILALTYVDYGEDASKPVNNPREIRELLPYSSLQCTVQSSDEDKDQNSTRFGLPMLYSVRRSGFGAQQKKIHFSRVIHCATRLLDHPWKGLSVLEVIYDDQTVLRNERWALGETLIRHAAGFANITLKGRNRKQIEDFEAKQQLHQLNTRSYFIHDENATVDWVGAAGKALNPEPYVNPTMESLSCGSRIPLSHLRGANAGTLAASEVNDREYWGGIATLQLLYESTIWELIDRLVETGQIRKVNDYRVVWLAGFELTEQGKAAIKLQLAQAHNFESGWKTVDELRAEEKLDPLPDGAGKVVLGLKKTEQQPFGQSSVSASPGADETLWNRFVSWLRGGKNIEDSKS
jgi:hypothetical protein